MFTTTQVIMVQFRDKRLKFRRTEFANLTDSQWQIIETFLDTERPRKYSLRDIVDAIRKLTVTGCQWRNMDKSYPMWQIVYYYYRKWQKDGTWAILLAHLVEQERQRQGKQGQASAVAIDSQSVKKGTLIHLQTGIDGGKLVNGRKRHIVVDTLGLPLAIHVSAANVYDGQAGIELLWQLEKASKRLELIRADNAYKGQFVIAAGYYKWQVDITQKPPSDKGFIPQSGRWQVERTFAWCNFFRRLSKDYEKTVESSAAFVQIACIDMILARLAN